MSYQKQKDRLSNRYPAIEDLARKAKRRIPQVAWEYLISGTGDEALVDRNKSAFQRINFIPRFCKGSLAATTATSLFGKNYSAPIGIAPVGLTGLMWPRVEHYLAATADAQRAYDELIQSGRATQFQQDSAYLQLLNVMADETEATTGNIPVQLQQALQDMNAKVNDPNYGVPALTQSFTAMFGTISTGLSDITNNAIHALIHGDMDSLKDLGGSLKQLGLDALSNFAQPFIDMITGPNGIIKQGLDLLLNKLLDMTGLLGGLFGGGGGSSSVIQGLTSTGGNLLNLGIPGLGAGAGAAGAAGSGAASAAISAGLQSTLGLVFGGITAASSVASLLFSYGGLFGAAEGDADVANSHSLQLLNETRTRKKDAWDQHWDIMGKWDIVIPNLEDMASDLGYVLQKIEMEGGLLGLTNSIEASVFWTLKKIEGWDGWIEGTLKSIESNLVAIRETGMKVENHIYLDSREIATVMGESVAIQGI